MNYYEKLTHQHSDEDTRIISETELVKSLLNFCMLNHGAKITISVEHDNGHKATANLFDHAALVTSLFETLDYFESEYI